MNTSSVSPAYRRPSGGVSSTETTTARTAILKQIALLQKQEARLGEQLAALSGSVGTADIQARIALQQQIQGIEDQIAALQIALLQQDADRTVKISKTDDEAPQSVDKPAAEAAAAPTAPDAAGPKAIGSLIDTRA